LVIVGPGALGCLLAARLWLAGGQEVLLLDHDPHRASRLKRQGIILEQGEERRTAKPGVSRDPETLPGAVVCVCIKSFSFESFFLSHERKLSQARLVVGFQNGIRHLEHLSRLPAGIAAAAVTTEGATLLGEGHVRHGGSGLTRIGWVGAPGSGDLLAGLQTALAGAGFSVSLSRDIVTDAWKKLLVNVGINALTAIHNCPNGELLSRPDLREKLVRAVTEAAQVAEASGVCLSFDPVAETLEVCRKTRENISSMLQDVRRNRPTEIEMINGEIVRRARMLSIPVPQNERLVEEVRTLSRHFS